jgi:hypothetical protein
MMVNYCAWNVHELGTGDVASNPDCELGLLTSQRKNAQSAQLGVERAEFVKKITAERHRGPDEVANGSNRLRQAGVAAANHPIELGRHPSRAFARPDGQGSASGTDHPRHVVLRKQLLEPTGVRLCIVVEERHDVTPRCSDARVTGAR